MTIFPSACIWAQETPIQETLQSIKQTAFHYIDVEPATLDAPGGRESIKGLGLKVSCVALDHNLPGVCSWDKDAESLRRTLDHLQHALLKSQSLGATTAYVGPCQERKNLKRFGESLSGLSEFAVKHGIKLCLEHAPGRALFKASDALAFLEEIQQPNLYLLLDVGHTQLSKEKPW